MTEARDGYQVYINLLEPLMTDIDAGREVRISVSDSATWGLVQVRAVIGRPPTVVKDGVHLWVRTKEGRLTDPPWSIHILEELDEDD